MAFQIAFYDKPGTWSLTSLSKPVYALLINFRIFATLSALGACSRAISTLFSLRHIIESGHKSTQEGFSMGGLEES